MQNQQKLQFVIILGLDVLIHVLFGGWLLDKALLVWEELAGRMDQPGQLSDPTGGSARGLVAACPAPRPGWAGDVVCWAGGDTLSAWLTTA